MFETCTLKNSYGSLLSLIVFESYLQSENFLESVPVNKMLKWDMEGLSNKPIWLEA